MYKKLFRQKGKKTMQQIVALLEQKIANEEKKLSTIQAISYIVRY